uniref:Ankyrin repeat and SOCS box protein 11 n=1 Tax=Cyclopterus lumpus TaxID=8103 RepID=A0A8C2WP88_CYCLU
MAAVQTEVPLCSQPWQRPLYIYGGLACNSLMAGKFYFWSDRTPLHEAAYQGRLLQIRSLIVQVSLVFFPLMCAHDAQHTVMGVSDSVILSLISPMVSTDGATPLFNSCSSGSAACVRLMLQRSASIHTPHLLASPVHEAAKKGHRECLELLLSYGADIDMELPVVGTPLYSACMARAAACVRLLLHSGAAVRIGCGQDSPLHAAVRGGGPNVVDILLDFGADECCRNAEGKTPLDLSSANSAVRVGLQKKGPCSLSQLCRFCIRQSLGRSRLHRASGLSLPHSMKDFLLYQ